jgi:hypothetical protein
VIPVSRTFQGPGRHQYAGHRYHWGASGIGRPGSGGAPVITGPLPVTAPNGRPFAGMDPSDPGTYVRPWNPADGMIGYLNFNGAMMQDYTDTGGVWSNPASWNATVGARPRRRPR